MPKRKGLPFETEDLFVFSINQNGLIFIGVRFRVSVSCSIGVGADHLIG